MCAVEKVRPGVKCAGCGKDATYVRGLCKTCYHRQVDKKRDSRSRYLGSTGTCRVCDKTKPGCRAGLCPACRVRKQRAPTKALKGAAVVSSQDQLSFAVEVLPAVERHAARVFRGHPMKDDLVAQATIEAWSTYLRYLATGRDALARVGHIARDAVRTARRALRRQVEASWHEGLTGVGEDGHEYELYGELDDPAAVMIGREEEAEQSLYALV
jgi:hypothetical protein